MHAFDLHHLPETPYDRTALVLFSGGQDSTTCLFWALKAFRNVEAIGFDYGQRHAVELEQARRIADLAGVPFEIMDLRNLLSGSALLDASKDVNDPHENAPHLPGAFVPARNALFLTIAAGRGFQRGIHDLVGGMCETDYSGYPDCRLDFIRSQNETLSLGLDTELRIHVPLMHLNKAETWKLAKDLGEVNGLNVLEIVRDLSHTDYHGDRSLKNAWGYGKLDNPASILRARGYEEAVQKGWL